MASPITSADFDNQDMSGSLCDQFREKLLNNDKIAQLLDYLFDENGLFNAAFLADFAKIVTPIGSIRMSAVSEAMGAGDGEAVWLPCDGQTLYDRETYPTLEALLGTTWNAATDTVEQKDASFRTPDFRGRVPLGVGTGSADDATAHALASKGGAETHELEVAELPEHGHFLFSVETNTGLAFTALDATKYASVKNEGVSQGNYLYQVPGVASPATVGLSEAVGDGDTHNNLQPFLTVHFYILAGYRSGGVIA